MVDHSNFQLCLIPIYILDNVPSNPIQLEIEIVAKVLSDY